MAKMAKRNDEEPVPADVLAQTENFIVWSSEEEGEVIYHVELDVLTLHFYSEDWDELVTLIKDADFARNSQ